MQCVSVTNENISYFYFILKTGETQHGAFTVKNCAVSVP